MLILPSVNAGVAPAVSSVEIMIYATFGSCSTASVVSFVSVHAPLGSAEIHILTLPMIPLIKPLSCFMSVLSFSGVGPGPDLPAEGQEVGEGHLQFRSR